MFTVQVTFTISLAYNIYFLPLQIFSRHKVLLILQLQCIQVAKSRHLLMLNEILIGDLLIVPNQIVSTYTCVYFGSYFFEWQLLFDWINLNLAPALNFDKVYLDVFNWFSQNTKYETFKIKNNFTKETNLLFILEIFTIFLKFRIFHEWSKIADNSVLWTFCKN